MKAASAVSRILVVEDEALIAHEIETRLRAAGLEVPGVTDTGEDAVELAGKVRPDLVLMDIRLKGRMDGIEAAENIRRLYDIPVVYLTAHADRDTLERAKAAEPFGYLTKPLGWSGLLATIEIAIAKHHLERQLREREAWLATTLHSVAEAVAVTDVNGRILFLNREAERLTGRSESASIGQSIDHVVRLRDRHREQGVGSLITVAVLEGGAIPLPPSAFLKGAVDTPVPIRGSVSVSRVGETAVGAVLVFRDVTSEQKQQALAVYEQKVAAVSRLAAGLASDLAVSLEVTARCSEELLEQIPESASAREKLLMIRRANATASEILRSLRTFSTHELTRKESEDLNAAIQAMLRGFAPMMGREIRVETELSTEPALVNAGCGQLEQILFKLALNAHDAMPHGGVLKFRTEVNSTSRHPWTRPRNMVRLIVQDSGVGIPEDIAEHLFEPFVTTKEGRRNAGMSLATVYRTVTDLEGEIDVTSRPGEGTTVTISLPVAEPDVHSSTSRVVLLVERDETVRNFIQSELEQNGFLVLTAEDGEEAAALSQIYDLPIHTVVAHQGALGENYEQVVEQIRDALPEAGILVLTDSQMAPARAPEKCFTLKWPASKNALLDKVREMQPPDAALHQTAASGLSA